jgi:hypothetical protein
MILPALTLVPRYAHTGRKRAPLISIPQTFQTKKTLVFSQVCPSCPSCPPVFHPTPSHPPSFRGPRCIPLAFCVLSHSPCRNLSEGLTKNKNMQTFTHAFVSAVANEGRDPFTAQTLDIISDESGKNDVILMIHKVNAKLFVLPVACASLASRCPSSLSIHPIRIFGPCQGFPFCTFD